jgi:hypothetical protein
MKSKHLLHGLVVIAVAAFLTARADAQVQTSKSVEEAQASTETTVENAEVVRVSEDDLIVKMEDGTIRDFPNVSESARVEVDGKQLGIRDLRPGMKLQRTITTTTTPRVVTTVQTVTGKVFQAMPPLSVVLTMEDGTVQQFTVPKGQKFNIDGQMLDVFALRKGMTLSATKVVEVPETVVTQQRKVTGTIPADQPVLISLGAK